MIQTSRRSLITGLVSFLAAPAVVRAASLMPVKALDEITFQGVPLTFDGGYPVLTDVVRRAFVPRLFVQVQFGTPLRNFLDDLESESHLTPTTL